jgi:preprotein translocase subunit SecG
MKDIILVIDILAAIGIVALVLLQQGRGADIGAAFGSGASSTLFGARGSANFLSRTTAILAAVFFAANLALAWLAAERPVRSSVVERVETQDLAAPPKEAPAKPAVPEVPK